MGSALTFIYKAVLLGVKDISRPKLFVPQRRPGVPRGTVAFAPQMRPRPRRSEGDHYEHGRRSRQSAPSRSADRPRRVVVAPADRGLPCDAAASFPRPHLALPEAVRRLARDSHSFAWSPRVAPALRRPR